MVVKWDFRKRRMFQDHLVCHTVQCMNGKPLSYNNSLESRPARLHCPEPALEPVLNIPNPKQKILD